MAKREAEPNNNGINDDNSWLLPIRLRTLSLQQETAELQQETARLQQETAELQQETARLQRETAELQKINDALSKKLLRLQRQTTIKNQPQRVDHPATSFAQV